MKILGRSPVERQIIFARERGWADLDFVHTVGDDYAKDLGVLTDDGAESPAYVVYKRSGDEVRLFWTSEMRKEMGDRGQDPRDAPDIATSPHCGRSSTSRLRPRQRLVSKTFVLIDDKKVAPGTHEEYAVQYAHDPQSDPDCGRRSSGATSYGYVGETQEFRFQHS